MTTSSDKATTLPPITERRSSTASAGGTSVHTSSTSTTPKARATAKPIATDAAVTTATDATTVAKTPTAAPKYVTLPRPPATARPANAVSTSKVSPASTKTPSAKRDSARAYGQFGEAGPKTAKPAPTPQRVNVKRALQAAQQKPTASAVIGTGQPTKARDIPEPQIAICPAAPPSQQPTAVTAPVPKQIQEPPRPSNSTAPLAAAKTVAAKADRALPRAVAPLVAHEGTPRPPTTEPPKLPRTGLFGALRGAPSKPPAPPLTAKQRRLAQLCLLLEYRPASAPLAMSAAFRAATPVTRAVVEASPGGMPVGESTIRLAMQRGPPENPTTTRQRVVVTNLQKTLPTATLAPLVWWLERGAKKAVVVLNAQQIVGTGTLEGPITGVVMHAHFTRSSMEAFAVREVCPRLSVLGLAFCSSLDSIKGLELLTALTKLDLAFTQIKSLDALSGCKKLESLSVSNCENVCDLSPVAHLPALKELFAMGVSVSSVAGLAPCESLETLVISSAELSDFSPIGELHALRTLIVNNSQIASLEWVSSLTNLRSIETNNCSQLKDISPLATLPKLERIEANFSSVANAVGLSKCTSLTYVAVMNAPLNEASLQELKGMNIELDTL